MKRRTLSGQIFTNFIIVIVISLSSVGLFSYFQSSRALDRQVETYLAQIINSALYQMDIYMQTYELIGNSIGANENVGNFLDMSPDDSYSYFFNTQEINRVLNPIFNLYRQLNLVYIIGDNGRSLFYDNSNQRMLDEKGINAQRAKLEKLTPDNGRIAIMNVSAREDEQNEVITISRKIRSRSSYELNGYLAIELRVRELSRIWEGLDIGKDAFFLIVDDSGHYVYHPDKKLIGTEMDGRLRSRINAENNGMFVEKQGEDDRLLVSRRSDYSKWHLVVSMPISELRKPVSTIRSTVIIVGLLTLVVAVWLAYRFGQSIVAPIRGLKESMRETEKGNWQIISDVERSDEIGGLVHSYNLMVTRLQEMIKKVYEAELTNQRIELERKIAEFQALQLQINPHFMYNTLETINCYAIVKDSGEISEIVEALAFMLRYSVQTNLEEITVANELNHVRNYLIILKHRIGTEFEIDVVIPPSLLLDKMVRLTLQPLVENIFQHAFPDGLESSHYIRIDAAKENNRFIVTVEDNGAGIPADKLAKLQHKLKLGKLGEDTTNSGSRKGGIGLLNVHRRIQMVFGEAYGLSIESTLGSGTKIMLIMPSDTNVSL